MTSEPKERREEPRRKGCLRTSCLVRAPLGCLAFFLGASVVLGFLLPASLGRVLGPAWEEEFAARHAGTLSFGELRLAWFTPQSIETIFLKDPGGGYVASAELRLPPLGACVGDMRANRPLELELDLDANLVVDDDGGSNLARALAARPDAPPPGHTNIQVGTGGGEGGSLEDLPVQFLIGTWRIACSTPRLRAIQGRELVAVLKQGKLQTSPAGGRELKAEGEVVDQGTLALSMEFESTADLLSGRELPRTWNLSAEDFSAPLLGALLPFDAPYAEALGERVGFLRFTKADAASPAIALELRSDLARVDVAGSPQDGGFAASAEAPASAQIDFKLAGFWRDEVVLSLLPFLSSLEPFEADTVGGLQLTQVALPRGGGLADLSADVRLDLPPVVLGLRVPRAGEAPAAAALSNGAAVRLAPLLLHLERGSVVYEELALDLPAGRAVVQGRADLVHRTLDLSVRLPAAVARELGLEVEGETEVVLAVTGEAGAPSIARVDGR